MAIIDRQFSWNVFSVLLGPVLSTGTTGYHSAVSLLQVWTDIEIELRNEFMRAEAGSDAGDASAVWDYPRVKSREVSVDIKGCVDNAVGAYASNLIDSMIVSNQNDAIGGNPNAGVLFQVGGPTKNNLTNTVFSGQMKMVSADMNFGDEAMDQSMRLVSYGQFAVTEV